MFNYLIICNIEYQNLIEYFNDSVLRCEKFYDNFMLFNKLTEEAPFLIELSNNYKPYNILSNSTAIFFNSLHNFDDMKFQLSKNLSIMTQDNEDLHFRFYDSRVLHILIETIALAELKSIYPDMKFLEYFDYLKLQITRINFDINDPEIEIVFTNELMANISQDMTKIHLINFIKNKYLDKDPLLQNKIDSMNLNYNSLINSGFVNIDQVSEIMEKIYSTDMDLSYFPYLLNSEISSEYRFLKLKRELDNASI
nr:DUF4123 domain-containing protein [Acinetobacter higginsii]